MKVLYAVQATGNGHITRARVMAKAFKALNIQVDWVFTGRPKEQLFDMQIFGNYRTFKGLTFVIKNGRISHIKTIVKNNLLRFVVDVLRFRFDDYDLIINDFEPVTAWAAKIKRVKNIGISHQMAFHFDIPKADRQLIAELIIKHFAPVSEPIGIHWDSFRQDLLPPIVDKPASKSFVSEQDILVYYPFCAHQQLIDWLAPYTDHVFHIFHGEVINSGFEHIHFHPFSRDNFLRVQQSCGGVITAGGFELPSEAMQLGQKMLIIPIEKQMEQQSNALALKMLGRATTTQHFSQRTLNLWLQQPTETPLVYPNVAYELAKWLISSEKESLENLSYRLWQETNSLSLNQKKPVSSIEAAMLKVVGQ